MSLRLRRILVLISVILFILAWGPVLFYTLGYRFSFADKSIRTTGGLFINTTPVRTTVYIDEAEKVTSFITGDIFVQNLKPGSHTIIVEKEGFYSWKKNLMIEPHAVEEAHIVLVPEEPTSTVIKEGLFFDIYGSPSGRYLIPIESRPQERMRLSVFDTQTKTFLEPTPHTDPSLLSFSSQDSPSLTWYNGDTFALLELADNWLLLTPNLNNTFALTSFYKKSKLSDALPQKPDDVIPHPSYNNAYFILSGTSLYIWHASTETLQPLLETIAGIAVYNDRLLSLDAAHGTLYTSTLSAGDAKIISTSSISLPGPSRIYETETAHIAHAKEDVWLLPKNQGNPEHIAHDIPRSQVRTNGSNLVWWRDNEIWIRWTLPEEDLPYFQDEFESRLYKGQKPIKQVFYYPEEHYIIFTGGAVITILEMDGRSGNHNIATLYEGIDPRIFVPQNKKVIYGTDNGMLFEIGLE
ncbi:MAG: hypothetical protein COU90_04465 [Candidatus Ryanbacteria bacterium CG10_big_fil_rev_8_21_14_0_10_43_42]|uniref:PEGA domain-containing protein n=1 Tax=Candidatus Ryanbacteria bacterium CG10_big_fil_rev_8_21_14_0_10_43_42 TaxID=1974864 RepID=A0A2M8KVZ2_9BACT|nr:MAG: hypothetical protein COU90_04465 [Candidatus Ryanbacteria bacterium CG10_big_fil_rev_8_21_14_0_10_43_42]